MRSLPHAAEALLARQHSVATSAQLQAAGLSKTTLGTAVRRQLLLNPHRGIYVDRSAWRAASDVTRHAMRLLTVQLVAPDAVGVDATAAAVWQLPVRRLPDQPRIARPPGRSRLAGAQVTRRPIADDDTRIVEGLRVAAIVSTVVTIAATTPLPDALITADAALRRGVSPEELTAYARQLPIFTQRRRAESVIAHATPWSESWLESLSRGHMVLHEMPLPLCNVTLVANGRTARVDYLWPVQGVVGESDGKAKYLLGGDPSEAHWQEKRRQEWLQELGFEVVRWGTPEVVKTAEPMRRRVLRALARQARAGFFWPAGVRAELRQLPGVAAPDRLLSELAQLRGLGLPITLVQAEPWRVRPPLPSLWTPPT